MIEKIATFYLTEEQAKPFLDENQGYVRRMKRAFNTRSSKEFKAAVEDYNRRIIRLRQDGTIARNLDQMRSLNLDLVDRILTQTYERTVSPRAHLLKKYEAGSDNVYGELLARFSSEIFQKTNLRSDQVFVDLGSGVGNVVLQAALEIGCESWGCEIMKDATELAELQHREFKARCRLWGLLPGQVHLEKGDFMKNTEISKALQRADVVLVNNQVFQPQLNNDLVHRFLDLKEGCQIVSLKKLVDPDKRITERNMNSIANLFTWVQKDVEYYSNMVSWAETSGTYQIVKKDSSAIEEFQRRSQGGRESSLFDD